MPYSQDPGGRFASVAHRKVLAHLSTPQDEYGWSAQALIVRMIADGEINITDVGEMEAVLGDLRQRGYAESVSDDNTDVWRMTQSGFDILNGSIANEPPPGAAVQGPAMISSPFGAGGATKIGVSSEPNAA